MIASPVPCAGYVPSELARQRRLCTGRPSLSPVIVTGVAKGTLFCDTLAELVCGRVRPFRPIYGSVLYVGDDGGLLQGPVLGARACLRHRDAQGAVLSGPQQEPDQRRGAVQDQRAIRGRAPPNPDSAHQCDGIVAAICTTGIIVPQGVLEVVTRGDAWMAIEEYWQNRIHLVKCCG